MAETTKPGRAKRLAIFTRNTFFGGFIGGLGVLALCFALKPFSQKIEIPGPVIQVEVPVYVAGGGESPRVMGWRDDPDEVRAVAATLPIQGFSDTPAGQSTDIRDHVYFWDASRKVLGKDIPARDQANIGSCVAHGSETAAEYLLAMQIAAGKGGEWKGISPEVIYGGSRVQIGKGQIRGDGSLGVWAAKWCAEYGLVPKGNHGAIDLTEYSVERCREYGVRGCPAELIPVAKRSPVGSVAPIRNPDEARKALDSNYPITIASSVGFGPTGGNVRDADGFLRASGRWDHQMVIIGYQTGKRPGFYIMNSWGPNWVSGPKGAGNPPDGGFWADESAVARILAQGDSWAYSDAVGFPKRRLDWFIHRPKRELPNLRGDSWIAA